MWNKIYLIGLAIALLIMTALTFYSYSWLTSIDAPVNVVQNYEYFSGIAWMFLWFSSIVLLVTANVLFWRNQKSWGFWATFLYFAFFVLLQTFWLDEAFLTFKSRNELGQTHFSLSALLGVILCMLSAIIVFFDQFILSHLHKKMYGIEPEKVNLESTDSEV